jgi:hypothetical protein
MPRQARLDAAGILHHVMIRGIERRNIFRGNRDRNDFIDRLAVLLPETKITCYAWAFMPNHALFCYLASHYLMTSVTDLAGMVGMSPSEISYSVTRGRQLAEEKDTLGKGVIEIMKNATHRSRCRGRPKEEGPESFP